MEIVGLFLAIAVVGFVVHRLQHRAPKQRTRKSIRDLKVACGGDQELVERLIFAEMQHSPGIDYGEAASRALAQVRRDRR